LFVTVGLDLESGWVPPLLNSARNPGILQGAPGYVDASVNVPLLQTPTSVTREQGDIHVYGNPHYWLDPARGKIIAKNILDGLVRLQPENRSYFEGNLERFNEEMDMHIAEWLAQMEPYKGARIVAYHNSWPYLAERFGLDVVDFLEPKPGIPPTPSQLAKIIRLMSEEDIGVIIIEPYFKTDAADLVARKTNGEVVVLATSVGAEESIRTYFDLFDYNVDKLVESFGDPN
ncbi:MAG: zinc ABC transporter substrate-binding protein, partial [Acidimicrobiia bacterium]|nr:zinc ABC transporter substrate-binding protein [Acidimicrobiia bacterium]